MEKKQGINRTRAGNFKKGSDLKKRGKLTAVHELPLEVRARLDQLLHKKIGVPESLKQISNEYPDIKFPSVPAVTNYRNKYLIKSLTTTPDIPVSEGQKDVDKKILDMQNSLLDEANILITKVVPRMRIGLEAGLAMEEKIKLPAKNNNDRAKNIVDMMLMAAKLMTMAGHQVFAQRTTEQVEGTLTEVEERREDYNAKITRILSKRIYQFSVKRTREQVGISRTPAS